MVSWTAKDLRLIKGLAIVVRGRFRVKKSIVQNIRKELGERYFEHQRPRVKRHRFSLGAVSFTKIDRQTAMVEKVHLAHCANDYYHFEYSESNGPIYDKRGKRYPFIKFDEDVSRILEKISSPAKRALEVAYTLPSPKMTASFKLHTLKVGRLRLGGMKLLVGSKEGNQVSFFLDWEDQKSVRAILRTRGKMAITSDWPAPLLARLTELMQRLRKGGLDHEIATRRA
jgi:hypothetical protein